MSKGFLIFAQNSKGEDYVKMAYALALSIKYSQESPVPVSLVTCSKVNKKYKRVFDRVIPIPWYEGDTNSRFLAEHRWKLYHASPYDETIVLDADMIVLEDISSWWDYCKNYDVKFCSRIKNYKLEVVTDEVHRKAFVANGLTNPYSALQYFKKSDRAIQFYKLLEFVCNNWEWCYKTFAPEEYQPWLSLDLAVAIVIEMSGFYDCAYDSCSPLEFIHMKPPLQNWPLTPASWQDGVHFVFNPRGDMIVGNIKQSRIFHYVEKSFLTDTLISKLERLAHES